MRGPRTRRGARARAAAGRGADGRPGRLGRTGPGARRERAEQARDSARARPEGPGTRPEHARPDGTGAETVRDGLVRTIQTLPAHLRGSLTWDQGSEMARHKQFSMATDMPVYFCDPASPWQRGSNENTNGLLRQYFPKGTDLSVHSPEDLEHVAQEPNGRPRKTLGWDTPAERLRDLLTT
ncbi:hypothetical protein GCM10010294_13670 [Streptomyces griseoloalbus]|nr:hypothetical protein GCM10010294_13670 [Streptomyces griseoloalbus]